MACCSSLLGPRLAKNKIFLGDVSRQSRPSLFVLGHFFLLGVGLGLSIKWAGVAKFFDPTNTILKYKNNKHGDNGIEHMVIKIKML